MSNPMRKVILVLSALQVCTWSVATAAGEAFKAQRAPTVDGVADDEAWIRGNWVDIQYSILGTNPTPDDFSGRYKVVWTPRYLYLLAEITDDVLIDATANPLESYWNDDTLEIFIDENASGGDHLRNDNAYAYHVALDNQVADIGPDGNPSLYPKHIVAKWKRDPAHPYRILWEAQIAVFAEGAEASRELIKNEVLGFMVAYCDADSTEGRDHFLGDVDIEPVNGDRNLGYIDASVFGKLTLVE